MNDYQTRYEQGWLLLRNVLARGNHLNGASQRDVRAAAIHFAECLKIVPDSWSCMWALGKTEQLKGNCALAVDWFTKAGATEPSNPDIWREASLTALALGNAKDALEFAERAHRLKPGDSGLLANLALALLVAGRDAEAEEAAARATSVDPDDKVNRNVLRLVTSVLDGTSERPHRIPI